MIVVNYIVEVNNYARRTPASNEDLSIQIPSLNSRSRSAPEKAQKTVRKNWNASSVNIQTARGDKMHLHAPGIDFLAFIYICCPHLLELFRS